MTQNPDLSAWLESLGLSRYAQRFADNHIEIGILQDLTEEDLINLGVSLGHRKKLLRAIGILAQAREQNKSDANAGIGSELLPSQESESERRQITVLFCDLVGSTSLSEKLDPEDLQTLIDAYRDVCSKAILRYGGRVARYFGDGVMAFFGWPRAHEDDAIRAVHAALEMIDAVRKIPSSMLLASRVGVSSGPVVVGEIGSGDTASSMDAVGETPNIAAHLQAHAKPNTVVISEATKRLVAAAFETYDLGQQDLKSETTPVKVHQVLAAKHSGSRFEAAHPGNLTPLAGRSAELNFLLDRWRKANTGEGQVILLSGIPGVGKSRLVHELKANTEHDQCHVLHYQCSPYHSQSAFFPIIDQIETVAEFKSNTPDAEKLSKLISAFPRLASEYAEAVQLIANLLSVRTQDQSKLSGLTPQQIKNRTLNALISMIMTSSSEYPLLCIFEDVHWIDPSTLELLELIINQIENVRVLLVISCRPEFRPAWLANSAVTVHSISRLSRSEVVRMVSDLSRGQQVSQQIIEKIIEKAEGVPLFVEEITNSILTASTPRIGDSDYANAAEGAVHRVPDTLHDALMERLDRVSRARGLAQIASVIGREFSFELLSVASGVDEDETRLALSRLEDADIVHRVGIPPTARYAFRHALLRDAIYSSLLKGKRRQIHADIASTMERQFHDLLESRPEILAYHYSNAENYEAAVRFWIMAGQRALVHSANLEAIAHYRRALEDLSHSPDASERDATEIEIQLSLGIPLIAVQGYPAPETREAFARARALCLRLDDSPKYFQALFGLWGHSWMGGKNDEAQHMADEFWSQAQASQDTVPKIVAHRILGSTLLTSGEFESSRRHFKEAIELSQVKGDRKLHSLYMVDPQAASLLLMSWDLWILGYPDQALARVTEALDLARDLAQPYNIAFAHYMTSVVHLFRGEADLALESASSSFLISREQRFSLYEILSRISRGYALAKLGRLQEAKAEIESGLEEARNKGIKYMLPMMESWLADVHEESGDCLRAVSSIESILAGIDDATGRSWESELWRRKAKMLLTDEADAIETERCYLRAIDVARRQSAKSFELAATNGLAALWREQGRTDEARGLLQPIYRWFKEGFETEELQRARKLLLDR